MTRIIDHDIPALVDAFRTLAIRDGDLDPSPYTIAPPATVEEREALARGLGVALPPDLAAFLELTRGIHGIRLESDFSPHPSRFEEPLGLGKTFRLGGDGFGNYWFAQPRGEQTWVWWLCHDPAARVVSGRSFGEFLSRRLASAQAYKAVTDSWYRSFLLEEAGEPGEETEDIPDDVDRAFERVRAQAPAALTLDDPQAAAWLAALPPDAKVFDLRHAEAGQGVAIWRETLSGRHELLGYDPGDWIALVPLFNPYE